MSTKSVMIVDDDVDLHESLKSFLVSEGFDVSSAFDGTEAEELLATCELPGQHLPDVILLDLMMPKMNGWELLSKLKKKSTLSKTHVVLLSAASDPKEIPPHPHVKFLAKPFDLGNLLGAMG